MRVRNSGGVQPACTEREANVRSLEHVPAFNSALVAGAASAKAGTDCSNMNNGCAR
jgi:hypothetical protein